MIQKITGNNGIEQKQQFQNTSHAHNHQPSNNNTELGEALAGKTKEKGHGHGHGLGNDGIPPGIQKHIDKGELPKGLEDKFAQIQTSSTENAGTNAGNVDFSAMMQMFLSMFGGQNAQQQNDQQLPARRPMPPIMA